MGCAVYTLAFAGNRVITNHRLPQDAVDFVCDEQEKLVRSVYAYLLAIILIPCLCVAQEESGPTSSSKEDDSGSTGSTTGKIVKAPGRAVGATARTLGKLIKPSPSTPASGQADPTGLAGFLQVQGTSTSLGLVTTVTPSIGYNFTPNFGADIGVPVFVVRSPFSPVTDRKYKWSALWGEPFVDFRYKMYRGSATYLSVLTGTIPAAEPERIFTTGRAGVDWFNHIETKAKSVTPFVNFGAANGTVSRFIMPRPYSMGRPYQTYGFMADVEGGANVEIRPGFLIGASAYALVPAGPQKVFSRLVEPGSAVVGDFSHNRYFYHAFQTNSQTHLDLNPNNPYLGSEIARDNGYSGWVELGHGRRLTLLIGYTRSVHYAYDALNVSLNFNTGSLIKFLSTPR